MASRSHDFSRRRPRRAERSRLLVVTEGIVTEGQYLEGLIQFLRSTGTAVRGVRTKGVGRDPLRVLRAAIEINSADPDGYDEVWVLTDVDEHAVLSAALEEAARSKVPMIVSNPCFEIWLRWHYQDCVSHQSADDLRQKLKHHGHDGKRIPVRFPYDAHGDAAGRAAKRAVRHTRKGANPSTAMPELLAALRRP
jgi:hypothetical protein